MILVFEPCTATRNPATWYTLYQNWLSDFHTLTLAYEMWLTR